MHTTGAREESHDADRPTDRATVSRGCREIGAVHHTRDREESYEAESQDEIVKAGAVPHGTPEQTGDAVVLQVKEEIWETVQITSHGVDLQGGEAGAARTSLGDGLSGKL